MPIFFVHFNMFLKTIFGLQARRTMLEGFSDVLFDLQMLLSTEATRLRNLDFGN